MWNQMILFQPSSFVSSGDNCKMSELNQNRISEWDESRSNEPRNVTDLVPTSIEMGQSRSQSQMGMSAAQQVPEWLVVYSRAPSENDHLLKVY